MFGLFEQRADLVPLRRGLPLPLRRPANPAELLRRLPQSPSRLLAKKATEPTFKIRPSGIVNAPIIAATVAGDGRRIPLRVPESNPAPDRLDQLNGGVLVNLPRGLLIFRRLRRIQTHAKLFLDDLPRPRVHIREQHPLRLGKGLAHATVLL